MLRELADGTRVELRRDVADAKTRDDHALFAGVACGDAPVGPADASPTWFAAWNAA